MLELRTLGAAEIHDGSGGLLAVSPKPLALLVYLAVARSRGPQRRDLLVALFHPELDHGHARSALRQQAYSLREAAGAGVVRSDRQTVSIDVDQLSCDVHTFEAALAAGDPAKAVAVYGGPFLSGFFLSGCQEFEQWVETERSRLERAYAGALEQLALEADAAGHAVQAVELWRRLAEVDPYVTRVTVRLIAALEAAGDRAGALHVAEQHARCLKEELDAEPSPEVEALARRLRLQPVPGTPEPGGSTRERLARAVAGRYRVDRVAGAGGMALVYRAEDLKLGRPVALKVLRPELAAAIGHERFLNEIDIAAGLAHPNILPLHDAGEADGLVYYVMPYVEGESLRARLAREGALELAEAVRIAREVADALSHAHERGIVHRDIKPANILMQADHAVVSDFGVARALGNAFEDRALVATTGTPAYMSPEQAAGSPDVDGRSDIYSLGCVLHEMLTGVPPDLDPGTESVRATKPNVPLPHISPSGETVPSAVNVALSKVLAPVPAERFATATEFADALRVEPVSAAPRPGRRRVAMLGTVTAAAVVAIAGWQYSKVTADFGTPPEDRPYTVLAAVGGSADSTMRETVEFLLRSGLDMAHVVQTVPMTEIEQLLTLMERSATDPLDPPAARELAERYGVNTIVIPRVDQVGNGFVVAVRVEDVATGRFQAEASRRATDADSVVGVVEAVVRELRRDLGESRAALANTDRLPEVLTPSLQALRSLRDGLRAHTLYRWEEAAALYQEAIAIDPAFAEAHRYLAAMHVQRGFNDSALVEFRRALETPERLQDSRRRDAESQIRWLTDFALWDESMFRTGFTSNDGWNLFWLGYVDSATTLHKSVLRNVVRDRRRFDPERRLNVGEMTWFWSNASDIAVFSGRHAELEALRDSLHVDPVPWWDFKLSVASADWDRADSLLKANPNLQRRAFHQAILGMARGRIRENHQRALNNGCALMCAMAYGVPDTVTDTVRALAGRGFPEVRSYAYHGVHAALAGDSIEVKRVLARFRMARDSATSELFEHAYEPLFAFLEAELAKRRGDWGAAARRLAPTVRKLGQPGYGLILWWDEHLWWVLADVYTHLNYPDSAIVQLEAIVERPPRWAYSAAHFKLGQLYAQVDNPEEALDHYTTFLAAFTDPDPEYVWMVEEARAGVERLERGR